MIRFTETTGYATQLYLYWLLGSFSSDVKSSARTGGLFRCFETAGQAISHGINSQTADKRIPLYVNIAVFAVMIPTLSWLITLVPDTPAAYDDVIEKESEVVVHPHEQHHHVTDTLPGVAATEIIPVHGVIRG